MDERQKIDVAVFRYGVIQDFVTGIELEYGKQEQLFQEKCARKWTIPFSNKTSISRSTLKRWVELYRTGGKKLESLYPNDREDKGKPRVLDNDVCMTLLRLRREQPEVSITFIRERIVKERLFSVIPSISTMYRFYHQHDLMQKRMPAEDRRRFEAEHPNDLWQSDVMHGPRVEIKGRQGKSYLIAFIDDHSRLIVYAFFYASENTKAFMHAFEQALLRRGLPRKFYVDNGSAYKSTHLMHITASLAIALIHARPYKPQGKGKIERFFKTVRSQFLPGFTGNTIEDLNKSFAAWLETYNNRKHSATGQKPLQRFADGMECIRQAPADLRDFFRKRVQRKITKDRIIMLDNHLYEGPVELIGKKVDLLFHEGEYDQVELKYAQKSYGTLKPVNVHVNCRIKRDKNSKPVIEVDNPIAQTGGVWGGRS
ncbi:Transposase [Desulfocicer vacuolatum DSM 3385]|uniref:Transposase n=1 Tax=Desulfocicer vacuolatum DSM 3385 TaxID=1121400 RepID=A0A1W2EYP0_9BACT|nr:DDE-type integrase/transposase/recombinase [Desulfocicer vacuolatum]SMD14827.1 Transposase [Desulfocicer vacuolatum DSM 3385]